MQSTGLAAILRDAVLRTAPQDEVAHFFTRPFAGDDNQGIEMLESDREKSHRWIAIVGVYQGRE